MMIPSYQHARVATDANSKGNLFACCTQALAIIAVVLTTLASSGATEKVLATFQGFNGSEPGASLIFDAAGNLYGTTPAGGAYGNGMVFKLTPTSNGHWKQTVLYSFNTTRNPKGPWGPFSEVLFDAAGNLYGTTYYGGSSTGTSRCPLGCGTVFKLTPMAIGPWKESTLYSFRSSRDGGNPNGGLVFDRRGNLYGTTQYGGANVSGCPGGCGTIFELTPASMGRWKEIILHTFSGEIMGGDGAYSYPTLTFDGAGNLNGTTLYGGTFGNGTVFQLSPSSNGAWNYRVIHSFPVPQLNGTDGSAPVGGIIADATGHLYGTTLSGGTQVEGTVFELTPSSNGWTSTVLYSFQNLADGSQPVASLIFDASGNLWGTVRSGGSHGWGGIFELSPSSAGWGETVAYSFEGGADGAIPYAPLVSDPLGNFYGTAEFGGTAGDGVVFEITH